MHRFSIKGRFAPAAMAAAAAIAFAGTGSAVAGHLLTGSDIQDSSLRGKDIKNRSLTGSDLKKETLSIGHFKASQQAALKGAQGAQGAQGPKGDKGDPGAPGTTNVTYRHGASALLANGAQGSALAKCLDGEKLVGGGGAWTYTLYGGKFFDEKSPSHMSVSAPATGSYPAASEDKIPDGWMVAGTNLSGGDRTLRAYAICAA